MNERRPEDMERDGEPTGDDNMLDSDGVGEERGEKAVRILRRELDGLTGTFMLTILIDEEEVMKVWLTSDDRQVMVL